MSELKPCPFCGGEAIYIHTSTVSGYIHCISCHMATRKYWDDPMSEAADKRSKWCDIATEAWDRRWKRRVDNPGAIDFDYAAEDV